jgi:hypothetical protein
MEQYTRLNTAKLIGLSKIIEDAGTNKYVL